MQPRSEVEERRVFSRFPIQRPVMVRIGESQDAPALTENVSRSGVLLRMDRGLVVGQRCRVVLPDQLVIMDPPRPGEEAAPVETPRFIIPRQTCEAVAVRVDSDGADTLVALEFQQPLRVVEMDETYSSGAASRFRPAAIE